MAAAARIVEPAGLRVPRCYAHLYRFLVMEFVGEDWSWAYGVEALRYLAKLHSVPVPDGLKCHYHGVSLSNRLDWELQSVRRLHESFPSRGRAVDLATRARGLPQLQREVLISGPAVVGHGDFRRSNLRIERTESGVQIVPIDWVDFGRCDPRYELAHFLDAAREPESLMAIAPATYVCNWLHTQSFDQSLTVGRAINALVELGSIARRNTPSPAALEPWLARLEAVIPRLQTGA